MTTESKREAAQCDELAELGTIPCPDCANGIIVVRRWKNGTRKTERCPACRSERRAVMRRKARARTAAIRKADPNRIDGRRNRPRRMEPCPICGEPFYFRGGPKSRMTCAKRECSSELMRRSSTVFKGMAASPQAARGRSRYVKVGDKCERCGSTADGRRRWLERHHIDENIFNNAPENIAVLCKPCHRRAHGVAVREPQHCKDCGSLLPSGAWAAALRKGGARCRSCALAARRAA